MELDSDSEESKKYLEVPWLCAALPSCAEHFEHPADVKPEGWNLWISHGLKRRIEAQTEASGPPASKLVQELLWDSLQRCSSMY